MFQLLFAGRDVGKGRGGGVVRGTVLTVGSVNL